ncbi:MAG: hypothetical protein IT174_10725 [Acidobacteria bacterium]|nr:hypothetical protein [Acidobacteriota bacterium]
MVSEARFNEIADGLIALDRVIVVSERAARVVAEKYPSRQKVAAGPLSALVRELDDSEEIEIVNFDDGDIAIE